MTQVQPLQLDAEAQGGTGSPKALGDCRQAWLRAACSWQWQIAGSSPEKQTPACSTSEFCIPFPLPGAREVSFS